MFFGVSVFAGMDGAIGTRSSVFLSSQRELDSKRLRSPTKCSFCQFSSLSVCSLLLTFAMSLLTARSPPLVGRNPFVATGEFFKANCSTSSAGRFVLGWVMEAEEGGLQTSANCAQGESPSLRARPRNAYHSTVHCVLLLLQ